MLLVADVGNTNIKFGVYDGKELKIKLRFSTDPQKTPDEFAVELYTVFKINQFDPKNIDGAIIGSVVPGITPNLKTAIQTVTGVKSLVVGPGIKTGLNIKIENPQSTGADLVCSCVGAIELYPCPCIVIGMGTATTMLMIDKDRNMIGGSICPGIFISLDALTKSGALLPSVNLDFPRQVIGRNTSDCIQSGVIWGNVSMIDGMIDKFEEEIGSSCSVAATGGMAHLITAHCRHEIFLNDDLILEGLRLIYEKNQ